MGRDGVGLFNVNNRRCNRWRPSFNSCAMPKVLNAEPWLTILSTDSWLRQAQAITWLRQAAKPSDSDFHGFSPIIMADFDVYEDNL